MGPYLGLALNNGYANATLYAAIEGMSREAFTAPRPGFFGSLAATLNHIHEVDLYYIDAVEEGGLGHKVFARDRETDPVALARAVARADERLVAVCHGLDAERLSRRVAIEIEGGFIHETVGDILLHLFQHQIHHRGQAHVQVQESGIAPPQLDDFFLEHYRTPIATRFAARLNGGEAR